MRMQEGQYLFGLIKESFTSSCPNQGTHEDFEEGLT